MIVRFIDVQGWRCFVAPVRVGPFGEGINVLHAPNGTGKSTLFEALRRALLDNHGTLGRDVEALRPWGRTLAPTVTVEFVHGGTTYRVTKRFLDKPATELAREEKGAFVPWEEGSKADERVRMILTRTAPGRGLARVDHWGIAQVLWAPQGDLRFGQLANDLVADVRAALGAQVADAGGGVIEARVEQRYRAFFAPKSGELKRGKDAPLRVQYEQQLREARARLDEARERYAAFDEASRRVEALRAARATARETAESAARALGAARARAEAYRALLAEKGEREERAKGARDRHMRLRQHADAVRDARRDLDEARARLSRMDEEAPRREREASERDRVASEARVALDEAKRGRGAVDEARARADEARRQREARVQLDKLGERLKRAGEARRDLAKAEKARRSVSAPDARTLKAIRKAHGELRDATVRLEAALITLEIVPDTGGVLTAIAAEKPGEITLRAGEAVHVRGAPEVHVKLAGVGTVRARGPVGSVDELRTEHERATRKLADLTRAFGVTELDELERLAERAAVLDRAVGEADHALAVVLAGEREEALEGERTRLAIEVERGCAREPSWREKAPDADALRAEAESIARAHETREGEAQSRWESATRAQAGAREELTALRARREETLQALRTQEARLRDLTEDGRSDAVRADELATVALEYEAAEAGRKQLDAKLASFGDDPRAEVERWELSLRAADERARGALEQEKSQEGQLELLAARGPYSAFAEAHESVERLDRDLRDEVLKTEAVRLLRNTLAQCRAEAVAAVAAPVEQAATHTLQRIAGARLGGVRVGESFEPAGIAPVGVDGGVTLESVSGGEREQIYLATRLALAEVLAREERQLVVLDDVLLATDVGRLARILRVLEEKAERLQILLITCHPERYRALAGAQYFDLEALAKG